MTATTRQTALLAGASVAAALLAGCSGMGGVKSASAGEPQGALPGAKVDARIAKAVTKAEGEVAKAPDNAAARAALGQAYLSAGRFVSAGTAFDDAMALGDNSGRTALGLALAKLGSGQSREAVAILDDWREEIPASDLGLALALSGETSRGVAVLADALRGGENTAKLRQNLAYAYALDGRWTEAKLMAAQDVPADQLDKRLAFWALSMLPDKGTDRVAALIGAPVEIRDPGQPAALALKAAPEAQPQLAMADAAPASVPAPVAEIAPVAVPAAVPVKVAVAAPPAELPPAMASTVEGNAVVQRLPAPKNAPRMVAVAAPAPTLAPARVASAARGRPRNVAVTTRVKPLAPGAHYVQLGAFSSPQGARRAWGIYTSRDPKLSAYAMTITQATVKGKQVWRVAAGGLSGRLAATSLCERLKASGGACFAYAAPARAPVAAPAAPMLAAGGPQRARR
ncbi:SPOR domain-containing protein [Novosphingobium flavum]|uniref:SPOR domain-containing protein n=1 Tax=Novosphingobium flavum TaxID=1778672 RepID=A0A7X1FUK6_9SPHN|nr:SPOR domain-containing protein [Novosphingobium flavum]MBC2667250.1 SPOR domain-containing protein [Novosphingobium flavum]